MCKAAGRLQGALVTLLVQVILVVACLSTAYAPESSTVEGVPVVGSAQGVPEPSHR
jgi:hypothetical protein